MVAFLEGRLEAQRYSFLTEVNVGSWSQKSVRDMAQEAGVDDIYALAYVPFSASTHSMWHHLEQYNLKRCENPLHRFHRVPTIVDTGYLPDCAITAAQYVDDSLRLFDRVFEVSVGAPVAYDNLYERLSNVLDDGENDGHRTGGSATDEEDAN